MRCNQAYAAAVTGRQAGQGKAASCSPALTAFCSDCARRERERCARVSVYKVVNWCFCSGECGEKRREKRQLLLVTTLAMIIPARLAQCRSGEQKKRERRPTVFITIGAVSCSSSFCLSDLFHCLLSRSIHAVAV